MKRIPGLVAILAALVLALMLGTNARAQYNWHNGATKPIQAGDIFIYRIGDGSQPVTNIGQSVFLDEYTPAAIAAGTANPTTPITPYQSIMMPTNWIGGEAPLIGEGPGSEEGLMTLSTDGRFLVIPGYAASIGQVTNPVYASFPNLSTNQTLSSSPTTNAVTISDIPRVVALLDGNGHVYMSSLITNVDMDTDDIRSAVSLDGTNIWAAGNGHNITYTMRGSLTSTQVCKSVQTPVRAIGIFGASGSPMLYVDRNQSIYEATNSTFVISNVVSISCLVTNYNNCTNVYSYTTNWVGNTTNRVGCTTNITYGTISSIIITTNQPYCTTNATGCVTNFAYVPMNPFGGAMPVYMTTTNFALLPGDMTGGGTNNLLSANGFVMFNLGNAGPTPGAPDTLYICDGYAVGFLGENSPRGGGVLKFCYTNGNWQSVGSANYIGGIGGENAFAVTGVENNPTNVVLYFTEGTNAVLYTFTDYTGYMGNPQDNGYGNGQNGQAYNATLWNVGVPVNIRGIAMAPQGGDSGTITPTGAQPSVGPPYGPYFRGPQGGPFNPSSYTYSLANFAADSNWLWSVTTSGTNIFAASPSRGGTLSPLTANGGSVTISITPNGTIATGMNGGQTYTEQILFHLGTNFVSQLGTLVVDAFYITPTTNFISVGPLHGPFSPASTIYTISNATPGTLTWSAFTSNTWDSLSVSSGSVGGGHSANITVSIVPGVANAIPYYGSYADYLVLSNVNAGTQISTSPEIILQVGFGVFDNFGDASEFTNGNVAGQSNWRGSSTAINPVQVNNGVYTVPGGCVNANGTSQQPYKYVASGPLTNPFTAFCTNINGNVTNVFGCNPVPTYACMGMLITFTNAPSSPNYVFGMGSSFLTWNDAGILYAGSGQYKWTTELNAYETGGGPHGNNTYSLGTTYPVFLVSDFVNSNAWVFVGPPTNDLPTLLSQVPNAQAEGSTSDESGPSWFAVWSDGQSDCNYCAGASPQAWTEIILGQYSACPGAEQPGYTCSRVAASTNFADVYTWVMAGLSAPPTASFTNNPSSGQTNLTVNFYDTSAGSPNSWQWSSGDCSYSYLQNPSFVYSNAGTYYATLTAISQSGASANIATQVITVAAGPAGAPPVACFTPTEPVPLEVCVSDCSTGSPTILSYLWTFGDGIGTSSLSNPPCYTYANAGTYLVSETVSNAIGTNTISQSVTVITPFQGWQNQYFSGGSLNANAAAGKDVYGTGMSNTNKFLTGFAGNAASAYLHVISVAKQSGAATNVVVTYLGASGDSTYQPGVAMRTNVLEYTTGTANGSYSTNSFASTGQTNILSGGTGLGTQASMIDTNGAGAGNTTRYYRVRVLLP